jgi:penicillin-binding protein 2
MFSFVIFLGLSTLMLRCWQLQIQSKGLFEDQALRNQLRTFPIPAKRGLIIDQNGVVLAGNRSAFSVTLMDPSLPVTHRQLKLLATILGGTVDELKKKFESIKASTFILYS